MGLSAREAAKVLGLTHPALLKAAKAGRITRDKDGSYDVEKVRGQLAQNSNALKRRKTAKEQREAVTEGGNQPELVTSEVVTIPVTDEDPENGERTLAEAQRRREWVRLDKEKLGLARERAELAPTGEINAWVAGMIIRAREILTRIAPELKDRLAQQSNPHECERLIADEVRRALNELAEFTPKA